ncbi:MAG: hypothetical protein Q9216_003149 [Gyalolechia sp. 2 TL-2023]
MLERSSSSSAMADETTPLLADNAGSDPHSQFCTLIGIHPTDKSKLHQNLGLYPRAIQRRRAQQLEYGFSAALSNTLLLSQVVLGATLTALGASDSSHILITIFGVLNTVIAGIVAFLKSRGQPMRARMFRDDLDHVVEEIENSKTMWLGIRHGIHGYDEIDLEDKVSVRSEVARLSRLYESAVKKYVQNNPDAYSTAGGVLDAITGLRSRPTQGTHPDGQATEASIAHPGYTGASGGGGGGGGRDEAEESPATAKRKYTYRADKDADENSGSTGHSETTAQSQSKDLDKGGEPNGNANPSPAAGETTGDHGDGTSVHQSATEAPVAQDETGYADEEPRGGHGVDQASSGAPQVNSNS